MKAAAQQAAMPEMLAAREQMLEAAEQAVTLALRLTPGVEPMEQLMLARMAAMATLTRAMLRNT